MLYGLLVNYSGNLLQFIRGARVVDSNLHLASFSCMLPYFICDRINYARYGTDDFLEMTALEQTHPGLYYNQKCCDIASSYERKNLHLNRKFIVLL